MVAALTSECDLGESGCGPSINVDRYCGAELLLTLSITRVVERGSLEVSIWGSEDGSEWRPLSRFPRIFYCGEYRTRIGLADHPSTRFLQARWRGECWGRRGARALFTAQILMEPAPAIE